MLPEALAHPQYYPSHCLVLSCSPSKKHTYEHSLRLLQAMSPLAAQFAWRLFPRAAAGMPGKCRTTWYPSCSWCLPILYPCHHTDSAVYCLDALRFCKAFLVYNYLGVVACNEEAMRQSACSTVDSHSHQDAGNISHSASVINDNMTQAIANMTSCERVYIRTPTGPGGMSGPLR